MTTDFKPSFELRIGLVMFGGTSLAVYMNGVILELLEFIRASQQPELGGPYAEVLKQAGAEVQIDVISGTSAGGLNALVLAQALATGTSAEGLKDLWITKAQIEDLLRTSDPHAVLSGEVMDVNLGKIFAQMSLEHKNSERAQALAEKVPVLDLFLTATDIRGRTWAAEDPVFKQSITGVRNKHLFHLKKRSAISSGADGPQRGNAHNDFYVEPEDVQKVRNDVLVRLGRATSAFPGALPPVKFTRTMCDAAGLGHLLANYDRDTVWFSDGGILVNKPFAPVIKTIFERRAEKPVQRVVLYLEPDPADRAAAAAADEPHFMEIVAAPFVLPMNEDISGYMDDVKRHNERRKQLLETFVTFEDEAQADLKAGDGPAVSAYRSLRTDQARKAVESALLCTFANRPDAKIIMATEAIVKTLMASIKRLGIDMLTLDVEYQTRRLHYTLLMLNQLGAKADTSEQDRLALNAAQPHLWNALDDWNNGRWIMANALSESPGPDQEENAIRTELRVACAALAADPESPVKADAVVRQLLRVLAHAEQKADGAMRQATGPAAIALVVPAGAQPALLQSQPPLKRIMNAWAYFEARDVILFPIVVHGDLAEWDEIRIGQLTPGATGQSTPGATKQIGRKGRDKLASDILGHFGGFLNEKWRRNDVMWGRLDTVEQLMNLLKCEAESHVHDKAALAKAADECIAIRHKRILIEESQCLDATKLQKRCTAALRQRRAAAAIQSRAAAAAAATASQSQLAAGVQSEPAVTPMSLELEHQLALLPAERREEFKREWDQYQSAMSAAEKEWHEYQQALGRAGTEQEQYVEARDQAEMQRDALEQVAPGSHLSLVLPLPAVSEPIPAGPPDLRALIEGADIQELHEYLTLDHTVGEEGVDAVSRITRATAILGVLDNLILALNRPGNLPASMHGVQEAASSILRPIHFISRLLIGPGTAWWVRVRSIVLLGLPLAGCLLLLLHTLQWVHLQGGGVILAGVLLLPLALLILVDRWLLKAASVAVLALAVAGVIWAIEAAKLGQLLGNPLAAIPANPRISLLLVFGGITVVSTVLGALFGSLPRVRGKSKGIISLELAGSRQKARALVKLWQTQDQHLKERLGFNLGIDFLFILGYAPLLGLAALMAGEALPAAWSVARPLGVAVAWGQLLAGLLDMVENVGLMRTVLSPQGVWAPRIARWCATIKFVLVGIGVTFIALTLIYLFVASRI